jgi:branched-chain amino acid transport system permease protein
MTRWEPNHIRIAIGAAVAVLGLAWQLLAGEFAQELFAEAAIMALFALSLDFLARSGLVSFGHAGFLGVGAYAFGGFTVLLGLPPALGLVLGVAAGALVGLAVGVFAIRTTGAFFIMVTLAAAEMFYAFVFRSPLFNGADGMAGVMRLDLSGIGFDLNAPKNFATACMIVCIAVWLLLEFIMATPFGRTLDAISQNANRVAALGGRVFAYRLAAFTGSGAIGALAGGLKAQHTNFLSPDIATWLVSGDVLIAVIIGGLGTLVGGIIGSAILVFLKDTLSSAIGHWHLFLGLIFIVVALVLPDGLIGNLMKFLRRRQDRELAERKQSAREADA